jgi:hypothetical protein
VFKLHICDPSFVGVGYFSCGAATEICLFWHVQSTVAQSLQSSGISQLSNPVSTALLL